METVEKNTTSEKTMSRGEFLKRTAVGAAAAAIAIKFGGAVKAVSAATDNSKSNEQYVGEVPPLDKSITWIDSSVGGVMKYWNGSEWAPVKSTWG